MIADSDNQSNSALKRCCQHGGGGSAVSFTQFQVVRLLYAVCSPSSLSKFQGAHGSPGKQTDRARRREGYKQEAAVSCCCKGSNSERIHYTTRRRQEQASERASRSVGHNFLPLGSAPAWRCKRCRTAACTGRYGKTPKRRWSGRLLQSQLQLLGQEGEAGLVLELQRDWRLAQQVL